MALLLVYCAISRFNFIKLRFLGNIGLFRTCLWKSFFSFFVFALEWPPQNQSVLTLLCDSFRWLSSTKIQFRLNNTTWFVSRGLDLYFRLFGFFLFYKQFRIIRVSPPHPANFYNGKSLKQIIITVVSYYPPDYFILSLAKQGIIPYFCLLV